MTVFLLAVLAGMWGIVFLPSLLKARQFSSPVSSVSSFNRSLQALGGGQVTAGGRWVVMPPPPPSAAGRRLDAAGSAAERRRKAFSTVVCFCVATFLMSLIPGLGWMLWVHALGVLVLFVMIALLISVRAASDPPVRRSMPRSQQVRRQSPPSEFEIAEAEYESYGPGRFEPAGHGYRLVPDLPDNPLANGAQSVEPSLIKVYRPDDPPIARSSQSQRFESWRAGASPGPENGQAKASTPVSGSELWDLPEPLVAGSFELEPDSLVIDRVPSEPRLSGKPKMFLDEEEDFLQAQGL